MNPTSMPLQGMTRSHGPKPEPDASLLLTGVLSTLGLHGLILVLIVLGTMHGNRHLEEEIAPKMIEFEQVDLLALGEEKDPKAMPRISNPAAAVKKPEEINLDATPQETTPQEEPPPDAKEQEIEEPRQKMLDALSALNDPERPANDDLPEGAAQGVIGGTLSDAALANMMGTYQAKLVGEISKYWTVPTTLSPEEIKTLQGQVSIYIRLASSGNVLSYTWQQKSGNDQFDESIERVIKRFQLTQDGKTLPLPEDEEVRQIVLKQGLNLKRWEYTGR